jgi:hypothetical protein
VQLRDILSRELEQAREAERRSARRALLEELRQLERETANLTDVVAVELNWQRARAIAAQHPTDPEIQSVVADIERRRAILGAARRPEAMPARRLRPREKRHSPRRHPALLPAPAACSL